MVPIFFVIRHSCFVILPSPLVSWCLGGKNSPPRYGLARGPLPWLLLVALALFLLAPLRAWCGDPAWHVLVEPKFMKHEVSFPIAGSEHAVLVPALAKDGEPVIISQKEFQALGIDWPTFLQTARENASAELKKLTPDYTRDRKKVIEFATLTSDNPLNAGTILSPDFLKMFADTLGPKLIIAIPNRYTLYIFPALASHFQDYSPMIYDAYHATSYPVSMEAYELSSQGLKSIGIYQEP